MVIKEGSPEGPFNFNLAYRENIYLEKYYIPAYEAENWDLIRDILMFERDLLIFLPPKYLTKSLMIYFDHIISDMDLFGDHSFKLFCRIDPSSHDSQQRAAIRDFLTPKRLKLLFRTIRRYHNETHIIITDSDFETFVIRYWERKYGIKSHIPYVRRINYQAYVKRSRANQEEYCDSHQRSALANGEIYRRPPRFTFKHLKGRWPKYVAQ
jgi:hypothetical protein